MFDAVGGPVTRISNVPVLVADLRGEQYAILQEFVGNRGAQSWRGSHPHPVFSADGKRIYYNINAADHTQLHVAESAYDGV